jgi:hypothetical protein
MNPMKPPQTPWGEFPDVLIHASESAVKQHPVYLSAKTGDVGAADLLVSATLDFAQVEKLSALLHGRSPVLVSAHAYERSGVNAILEAFADELAKRLNWQVDGGVVQVNIVSHTGADGFSRLARQPEFEGPILPGVEYVLVDDFVGMGETLANLRGHIEAHGGKAVPPWL